MKGSLIFVLSAVDIIDNLRLLMHLYKVILISAFVFGDRHYKDPYIWFLSGKKEYRTIYCKLIF